MLGSDYIKIALFKSCELLYAIFFNAFTLISLLMLSFYGGPQMFIPGAEQGSSKQSCSPLLLTKIVAAAVAGERAKFYMYVRE